MVDPDLAVRGGMGTVAGFGLKRGLLARESRQAERKERR